MTLYVDSSAFVKRYAPSEVDYEDCIRRMSSHDDWMTSKLTAIEAPRAIRRMSTPERALSSISAFDLDLSESIEIEMDRGVVALARAIALETGIKTLDAIHIASAKRFPDPDLEFLTYDDRQAKAAEALGLTLAR
ncbi:MAG: hypothetical protein JWL76_305 [Thermoleophilia bacterium]|nr:hypothetical protein [Thermoleophilia bacterium]